MQMPTIEDSRYTFESKNVTINYEALRRYLEQNSIIRKFGY